MGSWYDPSFKAYICMDRKCSTGVKTNSLSHLPVTCKPDYCAPSSWFSLLNLCLFTLLKTYTLNAKLHFFSNLVWISESANLSILIGNSRGDYEEIGPGATALLSNSYLSNSCTLQLFWHQDVEYASCAGTECRRMSHSASCRSQLDKEHSRQPQPHCMFQESTRLSDKMANKDKKSAVEWREQSLGCRKRTDFIPPPS